MPLTPLEEMIYERLHNVKLRENPLVLNREHVRIIQAVHASNRNLANGSDDDRRKLTRMIAEQLNYEDSSKWGTKAQSPTHPQSKDAIAYWVSRNEFYVWDWQNGSTRNPQVHVGQSGELITNQFFIAVEPVNHLGDDEDEDEDDNDEPNEPSKLNQVIKNQEKIIENQATIIKNLDDAYRAQTELLKRILNEKVTYPNYGFRIFGQKVTLKPEYYED